MVSVHSCPCLRDPCAFLASCPGAAFGLSGAEFCRDLLNECFAKVLLGNPNTMTTILGKSPTDKLTVEIDRGCSLMPSAVGSHSSQHLKIVASADSFRSCQDPSQAWPVGFGFAVLNASVLVATRRVNQGIRVRLRITYLSVCHILHGVSTRPGRVLPLRKEYVPEQRKPARKKRASLTITQLMYFREIIRSFHIYAVFGICLHAVVCAIGMIIHERWLKFDPAVFQRSCQFPFALDTEIAVYVGVELRFVVGILMIIGHPAADTVWAMIRHGHVPERTVTGVEATHVHLIHTGEGVRLDFLPIAMGCDVEKGLVKDISDKDS